MRPRGLREGPSPPPEVTAVDIRWVPRKGATPRRFAPRPPRGGVAAVNDGVTPRRGASPRPRGGPSPRPRPAGAASPRPRGVPRGDPRPRAPEPKSGEDSTTFGGPPWPSLVARRGEAKLPKAPGRGLFGRREEEESALFVKVGLTHLGLSAAAEELARAGRGCCAAGLAGELGVPARS